MEEITPIDVTAAILERDGKILIAQRGAGGHLAGKWEFPGGKVRRGESPEDCLRRELHEEFGIEADIGGFVAESTYDYGIKRIRLLAYRARHVAGEFVLKEHTQLRWVAQDKLVGFDLAPADLPLISHLN